jgi:hypothetical protein
VFLFVKIRYGFSEIAFKNVKSKPTTLEMKYLKIKWMRAAAFLFFAFKLAQHSAAQDAAGAPPMSVFNYLAAQAESAFTLELDLDELVDHKKTNQYFPARVKTPDGNAFNIEVRPRGKFRRKNCEIPPVKLKFSKKTLRTHHLDTLNEVKMLIPCFNNTRGEELILREYAAYKLYEKINPEGSVRARLVRLTIHDQRAGKARKPVHALLIEHEEEVAARLKGRLEEVYNLPEDSLSAKHSALNVVFQYMIGNTDWETRNVRNIYLLRPFSGGRLIPVPFDFDFSGLVSAPYATPGAATGLEKVQDRLLMADGIPTDELRRAVQAVKSQQPELTAICRAAYLDKDTAEALTRYLQAFFQAADAGLDLPVRLKNMR